MTDCVPSSQAHYPVDRGVARRSSAVYNSGKSIVSKRTYVQQKREYCDRYKTETPYDIQRRSDGASAESAGREDGGRARGGVGVCVLSRTTGEPNIQDDEREVVIVAAAGSTGRWIASNGRG